MSEKTKKLNLFALVCIATGNVVGAGIITTTGLAIAQTGRSVWISYVLAVLFGFLWLLPVIFFSSITKSKGGMYTMVTASMGDLAGGLYSLWWMPMFLMMGVMGTALGLYISSITPLPAKWAGIIAFTVFYVINMFGVGSMSKFQKPMTVFLLVCLLAFAVVGLFHLNDGALDIGSSEYYMNGGLGVINGLMLLVYSTSGHSLVVSCSWDAERPKKDIPLAIMISTLIIFVLYVSVSFVAGNVLPVEEVAGQPLTYVAKVLFPGALFLVFIIGGPIMALATSTNAGFPTMTAPAQGAIQNGWLPKSLAKTNKHGAPVILYTIMYLLGVVPMLFGASLSALTAYTVMAQRVGALLPIIAAFFIPTKFKAEWEKSWLHMPNGVYYALMTFALVTDVIAIVLNIQTLSMPVFLSNLVVLAALALVGVVRYKAGLTQSRAIYTFDEDQEEEG